MIKRMVSAAFLVFIFAASLVYVGSVRGQSVTTIFINPDGSVSGTNAIQHEGNRYELTRSLFNQSIVVLCDNIILDGEGLTLQGPNGWPTPAGINLTCTGVTVQNFVIKFWEVGILGAYDGNIICNNSVIDNGRGIALYADNYQVESNYITRADYCVRVMGNNDNFTRNVLDNGGFAFWVTDSSGILITENNITSLNPTVFQTDYGGFRVYHNNFYNMGKNTIVLMTNPNATNADFPPWDNGYPSGGNYWINYATLCPNATEIGDSGIGDIPYNVTTSPLKPNLTVQDRYPLLSPFNIPSAGSETPQSSQTPTPTSSMTPTAAASSSPQKSPRQNEEVLTMVAVLAAVAAIEIVAFMTLRRNRSRPQIN